MAQYRVLAQVVSIVELVWYSLELVGLVISAFASLIFGADVPGLHRSYGFFELLAIWAIVFILHGLQLWLSYKLFLFSKPSADRTEAIKWTFYWRIFCVGMLVLTVVSLPFNILSITIVFGILIKIAFRAGCLFVVHNYIKELTHNGGATVSGGDNKV